MAVGRLLQGRLIDAAVGRGALAVDVEVVAMLLIVCLVPEAQNHVLVTLTGLLVALCLVELTCVGERFRWASECGPLVGSTSIPGGSAQACGLQSSGPGPAVCRNRRPGGSAACFHQGTPRVQPVIL